PPSSNCHHLSPFIPTSFYQFAFPVVGLTKGTRNGWHNFHGRLFLWLEILKMYISTICLNQQYSEKWRSEKVYVSPCSSIMFQAGPRPCLFFSARRWLIVVSRFR